MNIPELGWLTKTFMAVVLLIPMPLLFGFYGKTFGMKPEVSICIWFSGIALGIAAFKYTQGEATTLYTPLLPILSLVLFGMICGGLGHILLAQAAYHAPNPGIPFALLSLSSASAYVVGSILARQFPQYFNPIQFNWINFIGIILIIVGAILTVYQKNTAV